MKNKLVLIGLLCLVLIVSACNSKNPEEGNEEIDKSPSFSDIYTSIEKALKEELLSESGLSEEEVLMGYFIEDFKTDASEESMADVLLESMELDVNQLANGQAIGALMNVNADKIIVLEAKTADDVADLKAALERELAAQTQTWKQYLPDQYDKVLNNKIETNGKFLLYVTFSNPEKITDAFHKNFSK